MGNLQHTRYTDNIQFRCLENLRETSIDLSLIHCGKEQCHPMHIWQGVRHEYIIHFVLSGKGIYSVGGKTWTLSAGQMFLIYPGTEITYISDAADPWRYAWVGFVGIRADSILKNCGFSSHKPVLHFPDSNKIMHFIDEILESIHLTMPNDLRRTAKLMELLALIIDCQTSQSDSSSREQHDYNSSVYVNHAIDFIQFSYQNGINVSDIAEYIGISRTYLNSSFQKELGVSVQKFLIDFRLHKAASLLIGTTKPINEISMDVGYDDALAFSKAFKKKFEVSPKIYREQKQSLDKYDTKQ
ncbi:MAG: AraC family transcriptional regulator [Eubacteriales bacterium]|nr:AraC family transcriptional regulator [Eubacteriales bacterium]